MGMFKQTKPGQWTFWDVLSIVLAWFAGLLIVAVVTKGKQQSGTVDGLVSLGVLMAALNWRYYAKRKERKRGLKDQPPPSN